MFAGALMIVRETKNWGAQGYVQVLGQDGKPGGQAHYRATFDEMEPTKGVAPWVLE